MTVMRFLAFLKNGYKKAALCTKTKIAKTAYDQVTLWPNLLLARYITNAWKNFSQKIKFYLILYIYIYILYIFIIIIIISEKFSHFGAEKWALLYRRITDQTFWHLELRKITLHKITM